MKFSSSLFSSVFLCSFLTIFPLLIQSQTPTFQKSQIPIQVLSLLSLKSSLKDPQDSLKSWDPTPILSNSSPVSPHHSPVWCSWSGIKCALNSSLIISLDLSSRNLSGDIPPDIRHLYSLSTLNLSKNSFEGNFPTSIFELSELRILDINHNNYNSTFPLGLSKLKFLTHFNGYSNSFIGPLPLDLPDIQHLEYLNLGGSYFSGGIPAEYGNIPSLNFLDLAGNSLNGTIPPELASLIQLEHLEMGYNNFEGSLPIELGMLSNLQYLDISNCSLSGNIPQEIGNLRNLTALLLFSNDFSGVIPSSLSNLKRLQCLDLSGNRLSGSIPEYISELKELNVLSLLSNELSGEIPQGVGELPMLEFLLLWNNDLNGSLPSSLGTNGKLVKLDVSSNRLTGVLPEQLCSNNTLEKLILFNNQFTGELPTSLVNCTSLVRVRIQNNLFNGSIPTGFGHLPNLVFMDVSKNNFSGNIPNDLGIAPKLMNLNVSENFFSGELPNGIWGSPSLQIFSASFCGISGNIPDFNGCKSLYQIEMEGNNLKGTIPWNIGHCEKLISLNLRKNMLTGIIPWEISTLPSINIVDLSYNNLSGSIPSNFDNCRTLETFNVSFNLLTGSIVSIPSSGSIFPNLNASSFMGNEGLCGNLIGKPCLSGSPVAGASDMEDKKPKKTAGAIVWIMAAAFGVGLFVLIAGSRCFHANYSRKISEGKEIGPWKLTAFQRLNFTADDVLECLAMSDKIIGMGATGTVYRAEMPSGEIIAIKKLWGKQKETLRRRRGVLAQLTFSPPPSFLKKILSKQTPFSHLLFPRHFNTILLSSPYFRSVFSVLEQMTPVCPFVKATRPDDASSKRSGENICKHAAEHESKAKSESVVSGVIEPKCPLGYDSRSFKIGPLSCVLCKALLFESSKCVPCSHIFCKACISRFNDCPLCGADIEKIEHDEETQKLVDKFIAGHARIKRSPASTDAKEEVSKNKSVIYEDVSLERGAFLVQHAMRAFRAQNVESAKSRLSLCAADIREQLKESGNKPELCSQLGAVLGMLGDCCRAMGDAGSAVTYFEESVEFLSQVPPDDMEVIHTLSVSLNKIGDLKYYDGDLQASRTYYFRSLEVRRNAMLNHHDNASLTLDVAVSLAKVADVDRGLGFEDGAISGFREGVNMLQSLKIDASQVALEQRRLSVLEFLNSQITENQPDQTS